MRRTVIAYYATPSGMSAPGYYGHLFRDLPSDPGALIQLIQHLIVYDVVAPDFYNITIPARRQAEIHIRPVEGIVHALLALEDRPLTVARPVNRRLAGRCHHFVLLLVGMLRAKGIAARARAGFGAYFNPPYFEDHWVCEYWNAPESRWRLADPQFDEVWRTNLKIDHDILDVPRDRFLVAADAWTKCRAGEIDPGRFGIDFVKLRGLWFVAGSLVRDVASLNKVETLPWDTWGAQPAVNETLNAEQLRFFDELAELTRDPDSSFDALKARYDQDQRLRVPPTVFNSLLRRTETL
jgi:hypothetical protein